MKKYLIIIVSLLTASISFAEALDKVVAIVNDSVIAASELEQKFNLIKQGQASQGGQAMPDKILKKQVLQHLIDEDLELQLAKQNSLDIKKEELMEAIEKIAATNNFTVEQLRQAVEGQGLSWKDYQKTIRKELLINHLQQKLLAKEVMVTPEQVEDYIKNSPDQLDSDLTYHLENIVIPLAEEPLSEDLKAARQKAFSILAKARKGESFSKLMIEESTEAFPLEGGDLGERHLAELPDLFAKEVIRMKAKDISGPIRAHNGLQLIRLISVSGAHLHHEVTKYHVRHILLKADVGTLPAEAKRQAFNLYQQIKAGKKFAEIAKKYSQDTKSAIKGGDLGWVTPGEVVPQFEKAMVNLPLHRISKPIKSGFGWHIIEVIARKKVDDTELYKKQQVRQFLQQKKFAEAVQNWQQRLRNDSYIKIMDKDLA